MVFSDVTLQDRELFKQIRQSCDLYSKSPASDATFESIYCWGAGDGAQKCVVDEGIIAYYLYPDGPKAFYPPLVRKPEHFLPALNRIVGYCKQNGIDVYIERLTKEMAALAKGFEPHEYRNYFEYLYRPEDIISLAGGHYKSKRNLLNGFTEEYDYEFLPYAPSMRKSVLDLAEYCCKDPDAHTFDDTERSAIERALDDMDALNLFCDVIKVDGIIIAFAIWFVSEANDAVCLFEKADANYRGSYAAINNFIVSKRFGKCRYINRQEDVGIEGLRLAKMSWHPAGFAEKYIITNRPDNL